MVMEDLFAEQRAAFSADPYPTAAQRRANLKKLLDAVLRHQGEIAEVIDKDFGGRARDEVLFSEVYVAVNAIRHARRHLHQWMSARPRNVGWAMMPASAFVLPQPVGVVGIIAPWNYPIFLSIAPLAGALAAGNRVMLKPSEYTSATSALLERILGEAFSRDFVGVVAGDATVGRAFASLPFDHLLFTGATSVGRDVMCAAAKNLTPVTLELGGKSPAIIAPGANIERAAADIVYGKLLNAGQTCIAPDYVLVPADARERLIAGLRRAVKRYYPDGKYTSIINERHAERLKAYLDEARMRGAELIVLDTPANGRRTFAPVVLMDPPDDLAVMREEIFGPISAGEDLPVAG